ncbi:hypothetical protein GCM10009557_18000 [Virgisporangium ochraceum]|uniref:Carrier domain-containing protein n=1 Tax=Virgisporangium ochraceum TaxID=65505 RepID=A0A8J4A179_9ACTN|nr:acyl carrier protein [Virgisporangium ochraceum]GIJ72697.1 hypothetical protein Voc01_076140 [Virgisporangium ochraceum]
MTGDSPESRFDLVARLIEIWSEVLVSGVVDGQTDFAELGGSSLTAVRIQSRIRKEFGRNIELVEVLEFRTPARLAARIPAAPAWSRTD